MEGYDVSPLSFPFSDELCPWEVSVGHTANVTYKSHLTTGLKVAIKTINLHLRKY